MNTCQLKLSQCNVGKRFRDKNKLIFTLLCLVYTKGRLTHFVIKYVHKHESWSSHIKYWKELVL